MAPDPTYTGEDFDINRVAIFSSAVGLARLALQQTTTKDREPERALEYLDQAVRDVDDLWRTHLRKLGYEEKLINMFLGVKHKP